MSLIDEKVDIDPSSIPAGPVQPQVSKKKKKPKVHKKKQKFFQSKPVNTNIPSHYDYDDYGDDDNEEAAESSHLTLKKYHGSVADLKKRLDDIDEKRIREYEEPSLKDIPKKQSKLRNRLDADNKKNEVSKSQNAQRLPKIGSQRLKTKQSSDKNDLSPGKKNNSKDFPELPDKQEKGFKYKRETGKRTIIGFASTGMLNNFAVKKPHETKIKIKKDDQYDVRFKPGESIRMLNRAISTQTLVQSSVITPYTEDLQTLKKKNELIKELTLKKKQNSSDNFHFIRKQLK